MSEVLAAAAVLCVQSRSRSPDVLLLATEQCSAPCSALSHVRSSPFSEEYLTTSPEELYLLLKGRDETGGALGSQKSEAAICEMGESVLPPTYAAIVPGRDVVTEPILLD